METSAWAEVSAAVAASPYPVRVLPADPVPAETCLARLEITTRSWLGAVVAYSGGLLVDHGWLRVLGCGSTGLPDVLAGADPASGELVVGHDVLGGQFVWARARPGTPPTVHYFAPDDLDWQDLEQGYADWLHAMLAGSLTRFYDTLRWPGWEAEVAALSPDQGLSTLPPPWTAEGKDLATVSRKAVPLPQLISFNHEMARQLGPAGQP
ncbi:DUF2625 family protein [Plantactinospora solaniradicis]|uniref:DUF2625 family protein n=1 Tax=Plantactinospora solaniradicis TaxID=1723736 RepID=A0ABW1K5W6_9ACTN